MRTVVGIPIRTLLLIIFLTFLVAGLTIAAFKLPNSKPPAKVSLVLTPQTILSASENPILNSTPSGAYYTEDIIIDTKQNRISSVQLELSFDPDIITVYDIVPGTFFDNPQVLLKTIDHPNGRISFAISLSSDSNVLGSGVIASLNLTLAKTQKVATIAAITFLPKTEVSSSDTLDSLLKEAKPSSFLVFPIISPTPTPRLLLNSSPSANLSSPSAN